MRAAAGIVLGCLCGIAPPALAQQLTYPGGDTLLIQNDGRLHGVQFNHSVRYDLSIGGVVEFEDGPDEVYTGVQATYLIKRINGDSSQTSFIATAGIGDIATRGGGVAGYTQVSGEWFDRRHFVSYAARLTLVDDRDAQLRQVARAGIAPWVAKDGAIQPFIAVQVDRFDGPREEWRATPFIRMVRGATLAEVGVNTNGGVLANLLFLF